LLIINGGYNDIVDEAVIVRLKLAMGDFRIGDNGRVWCGFVEADYWTFYVYRVGTDLPITMQTIIEITDLKRY